jgi:phage tail-like protein
MPDLRKDPLPVFCFKVNLLSTEDDLFFKSVSGLRYETEVVPVREAGQNHTNYQLWGGTKWSNIVLKKGFTQSSGGEKGILTWRDSWVGKAGARQSGSIIQLDTALTVQAVWHFYNAWPVKWEISEFDASKSELAIETLELAHEGLTFSKTL